MIKSLKLSIIIFIIILNLIWYFSWLPQIISSKSSAWILGFMACPIITTISYKIVVKVLKIKK